MAVRSVGAGSWAAVAAAGLGLALGAGANSTPLFLCSAVALLASGGRRRGLARRAHRR